MPVSPTEQRDMHLSQLTVATLSFLGIACALRLDGAKPPRGGSPSTLPERELTPDIREQEQVWMAAYAAGDDAMFDSLFKSLAPRLTAFFMRAFPDRALSDDLLQSTFVRLHAARHSYRRGAPVRPWVFTIAARVRIDELRRRRRRPEVASEVDTEQVDAGSPDHVLDDDARIRRVRDAIDSLPESQRMVIHLHRFEELSYAQIGEALGVSEGAARVRAFCAYATLRERLLPLTAEEPPT
jgi:RNA polymerase sigma-70 factor (ECF subfamily)